MIATGGLKSDLLKVGTTQQNVDDARVSGRRLSFLVGNFGRATRFLRPSRHEMLEELQAAHVATNVRICLGHQLLS